MNAVIPQGAHLADLAHQINAEHDARVESANQTLAHARAAGLLLKDAKATLPHGKWTGWVAEHCKFSDRTAQVYMQVAQRWAQLEANPQHVADLSLRKAIEIMAPPKPAAIPAPQSARKAPEHSAPWPTCLHPA